MIEKSMTDTSPMRSEFADALRRHSTLILSEGVVLMVLGAVAAGMPLVSTLAIEILVGWLFVMGGIVRMLALVKAHRAPGWIWSFSTAALATLLGLALVYKPIVGVLSMTMLVATLFVIEGVGSLLTAMDTRHHADNWGWSVVSGLVSLTLAYLIWMGWPATAAWAIGLLAGINLFFLGLALVMLSLGGRSLSRATAPDHRVT
jgi:uncharacterized membrane protein HdeD (DUF308 family)